MVLTVYEDSYRKMGHFLKAVEFYERSIEIAREIGNRRSLCFTLVELGQIEQGNGEAERSEILIQEALELSQELGINSVIASTLVAYGNILT